MRRVSPVLWLTLLSLLVGACGGDADVKLGFQIHVVAPDPELFPDDDPYEFCDYVRLCYNGKDNCKTVLWSDHTAALEPLPFGDDVVVCMDCLPLVDNAGQPMPGEPISGGCTPPFSHSKDEDPEEINLFLQKLNTTLTPVDTMGVATAPTSSRWGASVQLMYDDRVLIAGGAEFKDGCTDWDDVECINSVLDSAETFDPTSGQFAPVGFGTAQVLSDGRAFAAVVALPSGEIAFFGGIGANKEALTSVEIFDPFSGTFTAAPPMQFARAWHSATLFSDYKDGVILIAGGYGTGSGKYEIWNKNEGTLGSGVLQDPRWRHSATLITGIKDSRDKIVIAGGEDGEEVKSTYEIFDLSLETPNFDGVAYELCLSENEKLQGFSAKAKTMHAAALVPGQKFLYFIGGFSDIIHDQPTEDICVWNIKTEDFRDTTANFKLSDARGGLTATTLPGNVVLLAGGLTKDNTTAGTFETIFEYIDQEHTKVIDLGSPSPLVDGRWDHAAALLSDGRVLLLGGIQVHLGQYGALSGAELYKSQ